MGIGDHTPVAAQEQIQHQPGTPEHLNTQTPEHPTRNAPPSAAIPIPKNALLPCSLYFQTWNGLMTVDVGVGNMGLQRFVVDPGLDVCTLTPRAAQLAATTSASDQIRITVYDQAHTALRAQIPQVQFSSLKLENLPVGMIDVLALLSPAASRRPDAPVGWLGASLLSAFQVTFDYAGQNITLNRPEVAPPKGKGILSLPIEVQGGRVIVKLSIPGARPFPAIFSTSAPITVIPTRVAQQAKLKPLEMMSVTQPGGKAGKVGRVVLPKLSIDRVMLEGVNAVYVAPDAPPELSRELAIIGADLLRRYKVTISYTRHMMFLTPPALAGDEKASEGDDTETPKKPNKNRRQKD